MPTDNNFQEIYKQLGKPLRLAGKASHSEGEGSGNEDALKLFDLIYEAQSLAAELGWGDELEWEEVEE